MMEKPFPLQSLPIRLPVRRRNASQYVLIVLLSFAASVTLTRLFLELTGYPQLGGGTYHIAHVLWGGLLLFIAAALPLVYANRWVYPWSAFLAGAGIGLFIDEVGKFITSSNDYFFPLAAPIIYAFFLLTVLLYLQVRTQPSRNLRLELYYLLDALHELLDHDLDAQEKLDLEEHLNIILTQESDPLFSRFAQDLQALLNSSDLQLAPPRPGFITRAQLRWEHFEQNWLTRGKLEGILAGGLIGLGLVALYNMLRALPLGEAASLERIIRALIAQGQIGSASGLNWFAARLALETSTGLLLITAAALLIAGKEKLSTRLGFLGLLLSLTTVNLLVFYFDQFSTIITAIVQFGVLLALNRYRQRFL